MVGVFRRYEAQKERQGRIDFEDLLELAIRLYDEDAEARGSSASATGRSRWTSTRT